MKRLHIVGRKNSGKTTLIVELVEQLTNRGYRVGTIKHTHHHHELDTPGKDSHRHRQAGSSAVGILSPGMNAIFWPRLSNGDKASRYDQFDAMMNECDIVLVEGDSSTKAPKIEVFRAATGNDPIALSDRSIQTVVTDDTIELDSAIWPRNDVATIVRNIELLLDVHCADPT